MSAHLTQRWLVRGTLKNGLTSLHVASSLRRRSSCLQCTEPTACEKKKAQGTVLKQSFIHCKSNICATPPALSLPARAGVDACNCGKPEHSNETFHSILLELRLRNKKRYHNVPLYQHQNINNFIDILAVVVARDIVLRVAIFGTFNTSTTLGGTRGSVFQR